MKKPCSVEDCEVERVSKNKIYCRPHYMRWWRYGDPLKGKFKKKRVTIGQRNRCNNPKNTSYDLYGLRGIYVCDRWNNLNDGFENFISDIGDKPSGTSLDRRDNDGPYSPDNCRWATPVVQNNNKSTNIPIECEGEIKSMGEWGTKYGVDPNVIYGRIRLGWSTEEAIKTPVHIKGEAKIRQKAIDKLA